MVKKTITTIKLEKNTKIRLDSLKEYERETYDEVIKKTLNIINITIKNPMAGARIFRNIKKRKVKKGQVYHDREENEMLEEETEKPTQH